MDHRLFGKGKPIIGMIHLPPLITYANSPGISLITESALRDLDALEKGGVDGVIVENHNDDEHVIHLSKADAISFTMVAREVVEATRLPVGISALRNDWEAAFAIAKASGARFIRLDAFVDKVDMAGTTVEEDPRKVIGYRKSIDASEILLFADVQVKHARMLEQKTLAESVHQAVANGADVVIVSGPITGTPPSVERIREVKLAAGKTQVFIGSGLNEENATKLLACADGAIVGTAFKTKGRVDVNRVKKLIEATRIV